MVQVRVPEVPDAGADRNCRGVTQTAECSELHGLRQLVDLFQILNCTISPGNPVYQIVELLPAFPARGTFSAGLTAEEIKIVEYDIYDTVSVIDHEDRSAS